MTQRHMSYTVNNNSYGHRMISPAWFDCSGGPEVAQRAGMRIPLLIALAVGPFACSSIDQDVTPKVLQATLSVDPSQPDELADIDWVVTFEVDSLSERRVQLQTVALLDAEAESEDTATYELALHFPSDFDGLVRAGDEPVLELVNQGVTNAELAPLCNRDLSAFTHVKYVDDSGIYAFNRPKPAVFNCM